MNNRSYRNNTQTVGIIAGIILLLLIFSYIIIRPSFVVPNPGINHNNQIIFTPSPFRSAEPTVSPTASPTDSPTPSPTPAHKSVKKPVATTDPSSPANY